ncbi:MAG: polyprenyl diphosphate synthase, partial [Actinomadura sp.]
MGVRRDEMRGLLIKGPVRDLLYRLYEWRVGTSLPSEVTPRHVGVILDGNRRWARTMGLADVNTGHQRGADKISELLQWCTEAGVELVTLWLHSTDNQNRPAKELDPLLEIIENTVRQLAANGWNVRPVGALDLLPDKTARVLKDAGEATSGAPGLIVNVAVGYGGRREIADAVRSLLYEQASKGTSIEELAEVL